MHPDATGQNLLYMSDEAANAVDVFTFPVGKAAGVLRQFHDPAGICSDKSGEVWVVNAPYHILRYAHGGKQPESTLEDPSALRFQACSVDPASGDLAVTDAGRAGLAGSVVVFSGGKGTPHRFRSEISATYSFARTTMKGISLSTASAPVTRFT